MSRRRVAKQLKRVIAYIRVSKAREEMISPEIQREKILAWAASNGAVVVDFVEDLDLSGREFAKRKVAKIIDRIANDEADGVIVWKFSRWGRNLLDSLINYRELEEAGGALVSATEPLGEVETPVGRFSLKLLLLLAELQSDLIRESWLEVQELRRGKGLPNNGKPRFGYDYNKKEKEYTQNADAAWLTKAYEVYISGGKLTSVLREMNDAGVRGTNGQPMTYTGLLFILDSGFGAGKIIVNARRGRASIGEAEYLSGAHQPVIKELTWKRYLRKREAGKKLGPRSAAPSHKLSLLGRCENCERALSRCMDKGVPILACRKTRYNSGKPCVRKVSMREYKVHAEVRAWLLKGVKGELFLADIHERTRNVATAVADKAQLEKALAGLRQESTELIRMKRRRDITQAEYDVQREELRVEIARLEAVIEKASTVAAANSDELPSMFEVAAALWDDPEVDPGIVRDALAKVIREVRIHAQGRANRVEIIPAWADPAAAA